MYKDPLVNEVRMRREKLMRRYKFDVNKIYKMLKKREKKIPHKIVSEIIVVKKDFASEAIKK